MTELSKAAQDVLAERRRHEAEGWTAAHDDQHAAGELAFAGACYAIFGATLEDLRGQNDRRTGTIHYLWPSKWSWSWWKPTNRRRDLVKAGALILAEIERLDRANK